MKRIGQGKTKPRGPDNRSDHYGVYDTGVVIYEGYEHDRAGECWIVGLPLAGLGAAHLQPHVQLDEVRDLLDITYF